MQRGIFLKNRIFIHSQNKKVSPKNACDVIFLNKHTHTSWRRLTVYNGKFRLFLSLEGSEIVEVWLKIAPDLDLIRQQNGLFAERGVAAAAKTKPNATCMCVCVCASEMFGL